MIKKQLIPKPIQLENESMLLQLVLQKSSDTEIPKSKQKIKKH